MKATKKYTTSTYTKYIGRDNTFYTLFFIVKNDGQYKTVNVFINTEESDLFYWITARHIHSDDPMFKKNTTIINEIMKSIEDEWDEMIERRNQAYYSSDVNNLVSEYILNAR